MAGPYCTVLVLLASPTPAWPGSAAPLQGRHQREALPALEGHVRSYRRRTPAEALRTKRKKRTISAESDPFLRILRFTAPIQGGRTCGAAHDGSTGSHRRGLRIVRRGHFLLFPLAEWRCRGSCSSRSSAGSTACEDRTWRPDQRGPCDGKHRRQARAPKLVDSARYGPAKPRSGLPSPMPPATAPPAGIPVDERLFQKRRRTRKGNHPGDISLRVPRRTGIPEPGNATRRASWRRPPATAPSPGVSTAP
jgi:hypothetical protein